ncbi:MAG: DUF302 domain-containing protein [Rhodospirillales bacterium]
MHILPRFCFILALLAATFLSTTAWAADGLIVKASPYAPKETLDRLEKVLKSKGITVFARIDHAAGAGKVGQSMDATEILIFGNPKIGTPLMQDTRSIGIDLPLKALAWQDDKGSWIAYNDPKWLAKRHGNKTDLIITKMTGILDKLTDAATAK